MGRGARLGAIVALFAALNVAGWVWTHSEVRAAGDDEVRVSRAWPEQADGASELSLEFDRPLVGVHEVGQPLLRLPLLIEPPLAGGWQWAAPDRLVFLPSEPLPPGRLMRVNQIRLWLSSVAYCLIDALRRLGLDAHRGLGCQHGHPRSWRACIWHPTSLRTGDRPGIAPPVL